MRTLTQAERRLLAAFPAPIRDRDGRLFGGWVLPGNFPAGTNVRTIRNLYKLGLVRVSASTLIEYYPLELTSRGNQLAIEARAALEGKP